MAKHPSASFPASFPFPLSPSALSLLRGSVQIFILMFATVPSFAQGPQSGGPPFSPIENHGLYSIDLQDLHVNVDVPIRSKIGYGTYMVGGSSIMARLFNGEPFGNQYNWTPIQPLPTNGQVGLLGATLSFGRNSHLTCNGKPDTLFSPFFLSDSLGTVHTFFTQVDSASPHCYTPSPAVSRDNAGLTLVLTNQAVGTVYDRSGNVWKISGGVVVSMTDTNGNPINSLGGSAVTQSGAPPTTTWSFTGGDGGTTNDVLNWTQLPLQTAFNCSGVNEASGSPNFPSSFVFDSGKSQQSTLTFAYEKAPTTGFFTGRLASLTLPTGGQITFKYTGGNAGVNCVDGSTNTLTRLTPDSATPWTYVHTPPASGSSINTTIVTDPLGNETDYTFSNQFVIQIVRKSGGNPVSTTVVCYNGKYANCAAPTSPGINFPISQRDVYTQLTGQTKYVVSESIYDPYGNVTTARIYDAATLNNQPTQALSEVDTPIGTWSDATGCSAIGNNINTHSCYRNVFLSGTIVSSEAFSYDPHGNLVSDESSPYAVIPYNSSDGRHNLYTGYSYYGTGAIKSISTPLAATFNFTNGYCNGVLTDTFSVLVAGSDTLTGSKVWNCDGGVATSQKDGNKQPWGTGYSDPFWRVTSTSDPLGFGPGISYAAGDAFIESVFHFTGVSKDTTVFSDSLGRAVNTQLLVGSSAWDTTSTYYDALGRPYLTTMACATTTKGVSSVCATSPGVTKGFDALNRVTSVTDGGGGVTHYTYIAATTTNGNNVLDVTVADGAKTTVTEYDALGRPVSICEISSQTGNVPCGQQGSTTNKGFLTTFAYSVGSGTTQITVTKGVQSRTRVYDAIGRLTQETNPEHSGTIYYLWDTTSLSSPPPHTPSCPTSLGALAAIISADGNSICYTYDDLGRVTLISPGNLVASPTNPCRHFVYDVAPTSVPSGVTVNNIAGHVVEAYTDGCGGSHYSEEWFSYSARGEVTDVWQSTPNSGGFYHTSATYFPNGEVNTLSIPGQSAVVYGLEIAGRPYSVNQGSTALVNAVGYYYDGQIEVVNYGLGDNDSWFIDANTGRVSNMAFNVNNNDMGDILTWNSNWTLGSRQIFDNIVGSNQTQSCTYGYDDLARVSSVNCVNGSTNVWNQNFTYDQYGNITKTVPSGGTGIAWNPGYDTHNHYTLSGTSYDANGNLLNDSMATYAWNVYGKLATLVDSSHNYTLTYDAFGRIVEKNDNGTANEYMYSPAGYVAGMSGQTMTSLLLPLPGGLKYTLGGNVITPDWQGSGRLVTSRANRTVAGSQAYAPFGEMYATSGTTTQSFTGDTTFLTTNNGGLSDTPNRELRVRQGRWISPDPASLSAVDMTNPQAWNRYAYVANQPLTSTDPSGLFGGFVGSSIPGADCGALDGCGPDIASACGFGSFAFSCMAERSFGIPIGSSGISIPDVSNGILPGENSTNFPGPGLLGSLGDLLGLPLPQSCGDFGACEPLENPFLSTGISPTPASIQFNQAYWASLAFLSPLVGIDLSDLGEPPVLRRKSPPPVPIPRDPILKYSECASQVQNQATKNSETVEILSGVGMGNLALGCASTGPFVLECESGLGVVELLTTGVNFAGRMNAIWRGEDLCMQSH